MELRHIRSYPHCEIKFDPSINLFFGENGVGKTTLLECVGIMSTTRSFRTSALQELIEKKQEAGKITLQLNPPKKLSLEIHPRQKKFEVSNQKISKQSLFLGQFTTVCLAPEHHFIIQGSKQERLSFLDQILLQQDPTYLQVVKDQQKVLKQKRALLKQNISASNYIENSTIWSQQNQTLSQIIRKKRNALIHTLTPIFIQTFQEVGGLNQDIKIQYTPNPEPVDFDEKHLLQEFYAKHVLFGAHRDDWSLLQEQLNAKKTASQGEKSTILLALKFAEVAYLENKTEEKPVFLLDDIGTTLDEKRRKKLFSKLMDLNYQTLITSCDPYIHQEIARNNSKVKEFVYQKTSNKWV